MASWRSGSIFPIARRAGDAEVQALENGRLRCRRGSTESVARRPWSICCWTSHDEEGLLNYVGRARIYEDAAEIGRLLEPLVGRHRVHGPRTGREEQVVR